jgi:hypothetical protein
MTPDKWVVIDTGATAIYADYSAREQIWSHFKDKDTAVDLEDITGKEVCIDFSKVEAVYTSTPQTRASSYILEKEGDIEKKEALREAGLNFDND